MNNDGAILAMLAVGGLFVFIIFALGIVMYVLASLGLYKLATNQGVENPWLSWIPVANLYILGRLIKTLKIQSYDIPSIELVLPIGCIASAVLGNIPFVGWIIQLAYAILVLFALHKLYKMYRPDQAVLWLVLSIILPFMGPIFIFMIRNDTPISQ
jgi:uncharacterized membrane protein